jgi:dTDP-glucose 4,6-dehydratase
VATALVAGGAGFVGSHLCEALLERGDRVIAVDNTATGRLHNLEGLRDDPRFRLVVHDITEHIQVDEDLDHVLHLATPASPRDYLELPVETMMAGSRGTHNLLGLARAKGARFLLASTSEIYGDPKENPQNEDYWGNVDTIGVRAVYDEAKRFSEALVMAYHRYKGLDIRIVRIFNTYGPRMRADDGRVLPNFCCQALRGEDVTIYGDGLQTRSFCYIDDLAAGVLRLLDSDETRPVNIGNPVEVTMKDLAREVVEIANSPSRIVHVPLPHHEPRVRRPDITRAREVLRWEPRIDRRQGIERTLVYFRERLGMSAS